MVERGMGENPHGADPAGDGGRRISAARSGRSASVLEVEARASGGSRGKKKLTGSQPLDPTLNSLRSTRPELSAHVGGTSGLT